MRGAVSYKLRVRPDDFEVEEICTLPLERSGPHRVYRLEKRGWNTTDLLQRIARESGVNYRKFAFGGRKDRHAATVQTVTVEDPRDLSFASGKYSLAAQGFASQPMGPEFIAGNRFAIRLRWMKASDFAVVEQNAKEIAREGLVNYFDDQRFGGLDPELGLPGEALLRGELETALKIYLSPTRPGESGPEKRRKRELRAAWGDWPRCLELARGGTARRILETLRDSPGDAEAAVRIIPAEELSFWLAAAQARVWNRAAARIVEAESPRVLRHPGKAGDYLFYWGDMGCVGKKGCQRDAKNEKDSASPSTALRDLTLPTPGPGALDRLDARCAAAFCDALADGGLSNEDFALRWRRDVWVSSWDRPFALFPADFSLSPAEKDDAFRGRLAAVLRFTLPRGAFGALVVKRAALLRDAVE